MEISKQSHVGKTTEAGSLDSVNSGTGFFAGGSGYFVSRTRSEVKSFLFLPGSSTTNENKPTR
jgi:hypothetical protein